MKQKPKELEWEKLVEPIVIGDNVIVGYKNVKPKELSMIHKQPSVLSNDKSDTQPKELEWDRTVEVKSMNIVFQICDLLGTSVDLRQQHNDTMIDFTKGIIQSLLTQQRTELVEEIKKRVNTWGGFEDDGGNLCHYDSEILDWVNNLLNKKYETI